MEKKFKIAAVIFSPLCFIWKMETDKIEKIEIDKEGRLHIKPEKVIFPLIYRSATEVR